MKLVVVYLNGALPQTERALSLLPPSRREELARLSPQARMHSAFAELAVRLELGALLPETRGIAFSRTEAGKPYLKEYPGCFFSLSHSGEIAVGLLSDAPVGVDVEKVAPRNFAAVSKRFSAWEREQLAHTADPAQRFYTFWTARESVLKQRGTGLAELGKVELTASGVLVGGEPFPVPVFSHSLRCGVLPQGEGSYELSVCGEGVLSARFVTAEELLEVLR